MIYLLNYFPFGEIFLLDTVLLTVFGLGVAAGNNCSEAGLLCSLPISVSIATFLVCDRGEEELLEGELARRFPAEELFLTIFLTTFFCAGPLLLELLSSLFCEPLGVVGLFSELDSVVGLLCEVVGVVGLCGEVVGVVAFFWAVSVCCRLLPPLC